MAATEESTPPTCGQCGKPAIAQINGVPLCVQCYATLQNAELQRQQAAAIHQGQLAALLNFLQGHMESITGLGPIGRRLNMPQPTTMVHRGDVNFHNIKVDRSTVGVINSGEVDRIDAGLDRIKSGMGGEELAGLLSTVTEAILRQNSLGEAAQRDILQNIHFLVSQAGTPSQQRQPTAVIGTVLKSIPAVIATISGAADAWSKAEPILHSLFGI